MKKTFILLAVFLTACQGGKKINPNSSGAVRIIRTSELEKPQKEEPAMNVLPKGHAVKAKPLIKSEDLPPPPTVQKIKLILLLESLKMAQQFLWL